MAVPTNTQLTYDTVGIREELLDKIFDITPFETPFLSGLSKSSAGGSTFVEWQTDELESPGDNKHLQGDDSTAEAATPTQRLGNYTQIFKKTISMSRTAQGSNGAGRSNELAYQKVKKVREIKRDIEFALFQNNARVAGSSSVAGELAGIPAWLLTNTDAGTGGSDPTGDGTDARTDGTQRAFTETQLNAVMQSAWEEGAMLDTGYLSADNSSISAGFTGNATRQNHDPQSGRVTNVMDVYVTNFGEVEFVKSRHVRDRDVILVESDKWKLREYDALKWEPLAKTGDSDKSHVVTELTLECSNEKANAGVFDLGG